MSNASFKRSLAAQAALRASNAARSNVVTEERSYPVTGVRIVTHKKLGKKRVGWTNPDGTKGGCTIECRTADTSVHATRRTIARSYSVIEPVSGLGLRPNYDWKRSQ